MSTYTCDYPIWARNPMTLEVQRLPSTSTGPSKAQAATTAAPSNYTGRLQLFFGSSPSPFSISFHPTIPMQLKDSKFYLDKFNDTNPLNLLYQAKQYIQLYTIMLEHRLPLTAFYMQGEALSWFPWMHKNNQLSK
ncbi:hypothetical protein Syun_027890 [Stephania yunnanensis]|uniref:Uncharacterized protein n=1 Tax=Stephania yunnanensis TaxID=152371 RepID=A0AAP0EQA4_9MAGN